MEGFLKRCATGIYWFLDWKKNGAGSLTEIYLVVSQLKPDTLKAAHGPLTTSLYAFDLFMFMLDAAL
jgi:hypothetical protein